MMEKKRRRPLQADEMERVVAMLPKSVVEDLDGVAAEEGMSRSGLVRALVMRYLRERRGR